eukprot:1719625-Prymnesium_polylepis.1
MCYTVSFKCVGLLCVARWPDTTALRSRCAPASPRAHSPLQHGAREPDAVISASPCVAVAVALLPSACLVSRTLVDCDDRSTRDEFFMRLR